MLYHSLKTNEPCRPFYVAEKCLNHPCTIKKYGYIDLDGKVVIPFVYDDASPFNHGLAWVRNGNKNFMIDYKNRVRLPKVEMDQFLYAYYSGIDLIFAVNHRYGLMNLWNGQIYLQPKCEDIIPLDGRGSLNGLYMIYHNNEFNIVNRFGKFPFQKKFPRIQLGGVNYDAGLIIAEDKERGFLGYVNYHGKYVIQPEYIAASDFYEGLAYVVAKEGGRYLGYFINYQGEKILGPYVAESKYLGVRWYGHFSEGLAPVLIKSDHDEIPYVQYIDHSGKIKFDNKFLWGSQFQDGMAAVAVENTDDEIQRSYEVDHVGKWGYINHQGEWVIPPIYHNAYPFKYGRAVVEKDDGWGIIDPRGKWIVPPEYQWIDPETSYDDTCMPIMISGKAWKTIRSFIKKN